MSYTLRRVDTRGVELCDGHRSRFVPPGSPPDGAAAQAFDTFARDAAPGVYALAWDGAALRVTGRPGSVLADGMPVRVRISPLAGRTGAISKPAPPGPYAGVRAAGVLTLLTAADGGELYEACVAALAGWDGARFVLAPADRPRVASVAEAALARALPHVVAPLDAAGAMPLIALNAVFGPCRLDLPGRAPFPKRALAALREVFVAATAR